MRLLIPRDKIRKFVQFSRPVGTSPESELLLRSMATSAPRWLKVVDMFPPKLFPERFKVVRKERLPRARLMVPFICFWDRSRASTLRALLHVTPFQPEQMEIVEFYELRASLAFSIASLN